MKRTLLLYQVITGIILLIANSAYAQVNCNPVYHEGQVYTTVLIDSVCIMHENLNAGQMIQGTITQSDNGVVEKYCYNNLEVNCDTHGGLYNWGEMLNYNLVNGEVQGICPQGWHVADTSDWNTIARLYSEAERYDSLVVGGASGFDLTLTGYSAPIDYYSFGDFRGFYSAKSFSSTAHRFVLTAQANSGIEVTQPYYGNALRCAKNDLTEVIPFSLSSSAVDVSCFGGSDGFIDLVINGAVNPSIIWSNGSVDEDLTGLIAGTYTVTVTEGTQSLIETVIVGEATQIQITINETSSISCFNGDDGKLSASAIGGAPGYSYEWSNGTTTSNNLNLQTGTYTVTVSDQNGCSVSDAYQIDNPNDIIDIQSVVTNVSCNGLNDASIELTVVGGTYSYLWSIYFTNEDQYNLFAGDYAVTVTQAGTGACEIASFVITEPDAMTVTGAITDASAQGASDGGVDIAVLGGTAPYTYSWSDGSTGEDLSNVSAGYYNVIVSDANTCSVQGAGYSIMELGVSIISLTVNDITCNGAGNGSIAFTPFSSGVYYSGMTYHLSNGLTSSNYWANFQNLSAGTYTLTVYDQNGDSAVAENLVINEPPALVINGVTATASCTGQDIEISVSGGSPGYYVSYNGNIAIPGTQLSDVPAGTYTFQIEDSDFCTQTVSYTVSPVVPLTINETVSHVSCNGADDGAIQVSVSNGLSPYTYQWSNGASGASVTALAPGNYQLTVTDDNSCAVDAAFVIVEPAALSLNITGDNITYPAGNNGNIFMSVTGGIAPYTYNWSNGAVSLGQVGLTNGNYVVTVTDNTGCFTTGSIQLVEDITNISINHLATDVNCNGGNDGAINLSVSGGNQPYSYLWSNNATTQNISGLTDGAYSVTVTGFFGMTASTSITVAEPSVLAINTTAVSDYNGFEVSCSVCNDGSISTMGLGGVLPYSYNWSTGSSAASISNLLAGSYTLTLSDINGCSVTSTYQLNGPAEFAVSSYVVSGISCNGSANGIIAADIVGGVAPFSYSWNTGASTSQISNLSPGYYQLTVTDANSAIAYTDINIAQPTSMSAVLQTAPVNYPNGTDGNIYLTPSGGVSPYTYNWSNGASTQINQGLAAGVYSVTITDSNGCEYIDNTTVIEDWTVLEATASGSDITCNGGANGTASVYVTGGSPTYQYLWSNGATSQSIQVLTAGNYVVTVTDFYGTSTTSSVLLNEPTAMISSLAVSTDFNGYGTSCASCADGAITTMVTGGAVPYNFIWSNTSIMQNPTGLSGGTYTVTISDANGCTAVESIAVNAPGVFQAIVNPSATYGGYHISCNGAADAGLVVNYSGGVPPYSFLWSNGATSQSLSGLDAGTYSVTVHDGNSNTVSSSFDVLEPQAIQLTLIDTDNECYGGQTGAINVQVSGGIPPYVYNWQGGSTAAGISNLAAGNYGLTILDSEQCSASGVGIVGQADQISISANVSDVQCYGFADGSIDISIGGGTPPFSYSWSNGSTSQDVGAVAAGTYSVTIVDGNCSVNNAFSIAEPIQLVLAFNTSNISHYGAADGVIDLTVFGGTAPYTYSWSNGMSTQDISNLPIGTYTVTVTDNNGCVQTALAQINQPDGIYIVPVIVDASCAGDNNGAISLDAFGGQGPYTYYWSNGASGSSISGMYSGAYIVTVTDALDVSIVETLVINEPDELSFEMIVSDATCNGGDDGQVGLIVNGGVAPYTYMWNDGFTGQVNSNLEAGGYMAYVIDDNGCAKLNGTSVGEPDAFIAHIDMVHATAIGASDGYAVVTVSGSTPPYTYFWSTGGGSDSVSNLSAGVYQLLIFDANGCDEWVSFEIYDDPSQVVFGCTDPLAFNYDPNANTSDGSCYYIGDFPSWNYNITGSNHLILLSDTIEISLNGVPIENGDFIGVFYDNNGQLNCGGYQIWEGSTTAIAAWGDDQPTADIDGFVLGEEIRWKIYDVSEQTEYEAIPVYNQSFLDSGYYENNGLSGLLELTAITFETQQIVLSGGWSIMSTYIDPFEPSFNDILADVDANMDVLKNGGGDVYWPEYGLNQVGDITIGKGYQVKMKVTDSISVVGLSVSPELEQINVPYGWSFLGYLRKDAAAIDVLLYPIVNFIEIVKDADGNIYWPAYGVNNINNMQPGYGYQIRTSSACSFFYPANYVPLPLSGSKSAQFSEILRGTGANMTLGIPASSWAQEPAINSIIEVFSASNILVGRALYEGENMAISLWGDDDLTTATEGLIYNEAFELKAIDNEGQVSRVTVSGWISGDNYYTKNKISIAGNLVAETANLNTNLAQNVPNPATSSSRITYSIAADQQVSISLFNATGQQIDQLVDGYVSAGEHELVVDVSNLPAGVYMYNLITRRFSQTKYLTVVK